MPARRPLVLVLVIAVLVALAAAVTATAATEPVARHTAADMKRARQLVLARADLGRGWVAERSSSAAAPARPGTSAASALRCAGYEPDLAGVVETGTAAGSSLSFDDGSAFYSVGSAATVMRTRKMTTLAWDRSIRPSIVSCFRSAFVRGLQLGSTGGKAAAPVVRFGGSRVFEPSGAAERRVGFRLDASIRFPEKGATPLPVVIQVVFLSRGRDLAFATIASLGEAPPATLERTVSGRLAARLGRGARPTA